MTDEFGVQGSKPRVGFGVWGMTTGDGEPCITRTISGWRKAMHDWVGNGRVVVVTEVGLLGSLARPIPIGGREAGDVPVKSRRDSAF